MVKMSELLQSLQQQFGSNTAEITNKLVSIQTNGFNESENKTLFVEIDRLLEETKELLEQIELEIRGSNDSQRSQRLLHLDAFRKEYSKLKTDFRDSKKRQLNDDSVMRSQLIGSDYEPDIDDQKSRLLGEDIQRMEATDRRLKDGYSLCLESEQIGSQILEGLNQQRDTIKRSRDRLRATNHDLGRSHKILNLMTRRSLQTRVLIYFIFIAIFIVFVYLIYDSMT